MFSEKVSYYFPRPQAGRYRDVPGPRIPGRVLIKRCIAVGGQTVDINDEDGLVYVDGVALSEPLHPRFALLHAGQRRLLSLHGARGYLWMMGDNRTNSQDSRFFRLPYPSPR